MKKRVVMASVGIALTSVLTMSSGIANATVHYNANRESDATIAKTLNVTKTDLPKATTWSSDSPTPNTAASIKQGNEAVACMEKAGGATARVSSDPFGVVGIPSGDVTTDVDAREYWPKSSANELPQVSSETVMLKNASQATADLSAFATASGLKCFATTVGYSASAGSTVKVTSKFLPLVHRGSGSGGDHARFIVTGGGLPKPVYVDLYCYTQGRAEIGLFFLSEGTAFSSSWANSIATKVMSRAKAVLG